MGERMILVYEGPIFSIRNVHRPYGKESIVISNPCIIRYINGRFEFNELEYAGERKVFHGNGRGLWDGIGTSSLEDIYKLILKIVSFTPEKLLDDLLRAGRYLILGTDELQTQSHPDFASSYSKRRLAILEAYGQAGRDCDSLTDQACRLRLELARA